MYVRVKNVFQMNKILKPMREINEEVSLEKVMQVRSMRQYTSFE